MGSKKIYRGEQYCFYIGKSIGEGGNGIVCKAKMKDCEISQPVVAKFFKVPKKNKHQRYERFKKEIKCMCILSKVKGIMPIIDKNIPEKLTSKNTAWFLMPKAGCYRVNRQKYIDGKINDMLSLAQIIKRLHDKGYAHRDIKPENIMIYNGQLVLSDFGLIWGTFGDRITESGERLGPYKIMPPELEEANLNMHIDFRASDVYLFAKVVWMTLKEDNNGFRGQYNRGDSQIYLDKENLDIKTLEPIHKLMEKATCHDVAKRITIYECIEYLEMQKSILEKEEEDIIKKLQYNESINFQIANNRPNGVIYSDKNTIYDILKGTILFAKVFVNTHKDKIEIQVSGIQRCIGENFKLIYFSNGKKLKEYLFCIDKIFYIEEKKEITIELNDINVEQREYISFEESQGGFIDMYSRIYLSSREKIVMVTPD